MLLSGMSGHIQNMSLPKELAKRTEDKNAGIVIPLFYRVGGSIGDIEQFLPQLYRDIAGYPDLYVLGAYGKGRKQIQILNRKDDCCFGQKQHDPARNYDADIHVIEQSVKDRLSLLGASGQYNLIIDDVA